MKKQAIVMRKHIIIPLLLCAAFAARAQDRSRMAVYVPTPSGGTDEQREYFESNFKMELIGANYPSANDRASSLYTLALEIADNLDFDTSLPVGDTNKRFILGVKLERSADETEIVRFDFPFNDTAAMADWNLYLLYQAMANAAVPADPAAPEDNTIIVNNFIPPPDDRWRNQTFYLNLAAGADSGHFQQTGSTLNQEGIVMPAAFAGIEWVMLKHLALELDPIKARLLNDSNESFFLSASVPLLVKGVFRPGGVMLEPYAGVEAAYPLWGEAKVPLLSVIGGVQLSFRAGEQSAWTLDVGVTRNVLGVFSVASGDFNLMRFHIMVGWKFGWKDRQPAADRAVTDSTVTDNAAADSVPIDSTAADSAAEGLELPAPE
jgi:hypothetical protein